MALPSKVGALPSLVLTQSGDLHGVWPYLYINAQPDITAGCYDLGSFDMCLNAAGILTVLNPTGVSYVAVGSSVNSNTGTITGEYGVTLDLVPVLGNITTVGSGNQLPVITFNTFGQATAAGEGNTVIVAGQSVTSSTLVGSYGSTINLASIVGAGAWGSPNLLSLSNDIYGRITAIANGPVALTNNTAIYSNSGTIAGFLPGSLDLVNQTTLVPGTYGSPQVPIITVSAYGITMDLSNGIVALANNTAIYSGSGTIVGSLPGSLDLPVQVALIPGTYGNASCFASITVNDYGVLTGAACFTIGGLGGNGSGIQIILGTANQIIVTDISNTTVQLSLPQDIATTSDVQFLGLTLGGATANTMAYFNGGKALVSLAALTDGQVPMGVTGSAPVAGTIQGTPNQIIVTSTTGFLTLALADTPIVHNIELTDLVVNALTYVQANGTLGSLVLGAGYVAVGTTSSAPVAALLQGTPNEIVVTSTSGSIVIATAQPINTTSNVQFNSINLGGATIGGVYIDGSQNLASASMTAGQLIIGTGVGTAPLIANLLGTTDQVIITDGAGSIQISLPQSIANTSTVTFAGVHVTAFAGGFLLQSTGTAITESTITPGSVITTGTTLGGALSGTLPDPSLVTQVGLVPGTAGNTTCIPQITVVGTGIVTSLTCISIAGIYEGANINSTFIGTPNEIIITQPNNATLVFSTPQPIGTTSQVRALRVPRLYHGVGDIWRGHDECALPRWVHLFDRDRSAEWHGDHGRKWRQLPLRRSAGRAPLARHGQLCLRHAVEQRNEPDGRHVAGH
jgi:hypothetical protein